MERKLFSILIPVFNVEKYLSICLESVLQQSFTDYEIILVDDGSKDASGQICDDYVARYPEKIQVIHKPNQGLISARRAGLKLANGRYVCFLDSDDCIAANALGRLSDIINATDSDVIVFEWKLINTNGEVVSTTEPPLFARTGILDKNTVFERMMSTSRLNSLCKKCCKYELFDIDSDYSNLYKIQNGEDMIQSLPIMYQASTFYYLNEALYLYRINTSSITHVYRKGQHQATNVVRPLLYSYIEKLGLDTPKNKITFFNTYLGFLWDNIEAMYAGLPSDNERNVVLDELRSYEFVQKGREYLGKCSLSKRAHLGLYVFYKNNNKAMNAYMKVYMTVVKIFVGAKSALRRLLK